ncbi:LOW QUALITY PROTEIN: cryptochrome-1-like [Ctenocephalides felis]|uniref:LOW QUALITY PROTEIN: cryptochrome-1-like n=1 Tax=Ctenocephalides felis TaxID=7515 RepID=UPI000E6E1197|nr:LOW QUALITY PROTEIN: cryptochrome-1-like [Ctenocephalides felis]
MEVDSKEEVVPGKHAVHWFRRGLRLHDNPALLEALKGADTLRCVYILDPWAARGAGANALNKWRFLLESLTDLDASLKSRLDCRLHVVRGQPADALPALLERWGVTLLSYETDPEPYGRARDRKLAARCRDNGVEIVEYESHTLYPLDSIIEHNGGSAPVTFEQFLGVLTTMGPPDPPAGPVRRDRLFTTRTRVPTDPDYDQSYAVPTLSELGFEANSSEPPVWRGGEAEALARLERHAEKRTLALNSSPNFDTLPPGFLLADGAGLSPYLRFGCLSARLCYHQLADLAPATKPLLQPPPAVMPLLWREFLYCCGADNPRFDRVQGNPLCLQTPWDRDPTALAKWANGQTGFPWIDAAMSQLRSEGWIHHLARFALIDFLTKGALFISWEEGMKVFEDLLLDADWSTNAGSWLWLSCSSFFRKPAPSVCPVALGKLVDPDAEYIRKYVPALRGFRSARLVHAPWLASREEQRRAACRLGAQYPLPLLVDHARTRKENARRTRLACETLPGYRNRERRLSESFQDESDIDCNCEPVIPKQQIAQDEPIMDTNIHLPDIRQEIKSLPEFESTINSLFI